jgi:hypothetical protein
MLLITCRSSLLAVFVSEDDLTSSWSLEEPDLDKLLPQELVYTYLKDGGNTYEHVNWWLGHDLVEDKFKSETIFSTRHLIYR